MLGRCQPPFTLAKMSAHQFQQHLEEVEVSTTPLRLVTALVDPKTRYENEPDPMTDNIELRDNLSDYDTLDSGTDSETESTSSEYREIHRLNQRQRQLTFEQKKMLQEQRQTDRKGYALRQSCRIKQPRLNGRLQASEEDIVDGTQAITHIHPDITEQLKQYSQTANEISAKYQEHRATIIRLKIRKDQLKGVRYERQYVEQQRQHEAQRQIQLQREQRERQEEERAQAIERARQQRQEQTRRQERQQQEQAQAIERARQQRQEQTRRRVRQQQERRRRRAAEAAEKIAQSRTQHAIAEHQQRAVRPPLRDIVTTYTSDMDVEEERSSISQEHDIIYISSDDTSTG